MEDLPPIDQLNLEEDGEDGDDYQEILTCLIMVSDLFKLGLIDVFELRQIFLDILIEF